MNEKLYILTDIFYCISLYLPHTHWSIIGHQQRGTARRWLIIITIKATVGIVNNMRQQNKLQKKPIDNHYISSN